MITKKTNWLLVLSLMAYATLINKEAHAQDAQLTQFYAAPLALNPALTGVSNCKRFSMSNRIQWPNFSGGYRTNLVSYDGKLKDNKNSIGFMALSDVAGSGKLYSRSLSAFYAHNFVITKKHAISAGMQTSYTWRGADYSRYIFADQMSREGDVPTVELANLQNSSYLDFSFGALYYSERAWLGTSAHHLNQPNQSVLGQLSKLPIKLSVHGGVKLFSKGSKTIDSESLTLAFNYRAQAQFDQVDVSLYYHLDPIVFGVGYRGLPGIKAYQPGYSNNDALTVIVGVKRNGFQIGYSYDITISNLVSSTGGAHELTLSYSKCSTKNRRRIVRSIACPSF